MEDINLKWIKPILTKDCQRAIYKQNGIVVWVGLYQLAGKTLLSRERYKHKRLHLAYVNNKLIGEYETKLLAKKALVDNLREFLKGSKQ